MRHGNRNNALSRTASHRSAMLSNMASSLIVHKRINTTVAKAKSLRKFVEPLITRSKTDSTHSRRMVFSYLKSKDAVNELFREVAPKVAKREGGYTRIIKLGNRLGDAADMCMIELVDFNELMLEETKTKTRRSRRGGGKKKSSQTDTQTKADSSADEKKPEPKADDSKAKDSKETKADPTQKEPKQDLEAQEAAREAKEKEVRAQELAAEEKAKEAKKKIPDTDPKSEGKPPRTDSDS